MQLARGLLALALLTSVARSGAAERRVALDTSDAQAERARTGREAIASRDPREALAAQMAAELATLEKTVSVVDDKLTEAEATRLRRVRAAYRILRTPLSSGVGASDADRMEAARRRAAARLLLARDRAERELLADELSQLHSAETTLHAATDHVPTIALPDALLVPAKGTIVRRFGTLVHDRSRAVLARRGLDFEVAASAAAVAPADGIVRYAGPMRGLEHGVILDHGDYFTIVAKLAPVALPTGTSVQRGDRIGRSARTRIYLEVRAKVAPGGIPIDPEPLLKR